MNAELVRVGDTIIGKDGSPMKVLDVEHVYEWDGPGMTLRQILITLQTSDQRDICPGCGKPDCEYLREHQARMRALKAEQL